MPSHKANINVSKIDKSAMFRGEKGVYLDLILMENKDGRDRYGNDGYVVQGLSKERRAAGERGPIIGNWAHWDEPGRPQHQPSPTAQHKDEGADQEDDIPF